MNVPKPACLHACSIASALAMMLAACSESPSAPAAHASARAPAPETSQAPSAPAPQQTVEDEVLANVRAQAIGRHTLADLNLPEPFLRREADRIIRASFEERFRTVVRDPGANTADGMLPLPAPSPAPSLAKPGTIAVFSVPLMPQTLEYRQAQVDGRPPNRAYMPALNESEIAWPQDEPDANAPQSVLDAATLVAKRLALDGLLPTLVRAIRLLGADAFAAVDDADRALLRSVGLPIDLLRHFVLPGAPGDGDAALIEFIARMWRDGAGEGEIIAALATAEFRFQPTRAGFECASESGEMMPGVARTHMTRGDYWKGEGDGSNADMLRQMMLALPETGFVASVEERFAKTLESRATAWPLQREGQLTIVPEPLGVGPWAQDNAKAGVIVAAGAGSEEVAGRLAMMAPRYTSLGDDGSKFMRGESFLLPNAAAAIGAELVHSPLLFQGGNLLCVRDPKSGERILLVADADVYRNTALGLSEAQTLEAFRVEFGVDRCEMIETVSFHLDYDVSVRAVGEQMIALVADPLAASVIVARTGVDVLARAGLLDDPAATHARDGLSRGAYREFLDRVAPIVYGLAPDGRFPLSLAERFSTSPVDSGIGNLHRFLLALDYLVAITLPEEMLPDMPHARSYLLSIKRREADRHGLHARLRQLGMHVAPVPSTSDAQRSINAINGVHIAGAYLMPAYGGLFSAVDDAAAAAIASALGSDVAIRPILCGETQRRSGAVHCSLSLFPAITNESQR